MSIVACESKEFPVPPITAGSAKLQGWPIREAVSPWKVIRGNGDQIQRVNYVIHCIPST